MSLVHADNQHIDQKDTSKRAEWSSRCLAAEHHHTGLPDCSA